MKLLENKDLILSRLPQKAVVDGGTGPIQPVDVRGQNGDRMLAVLKVVDINPSLDAARAARSEILSRLPKLVETALKESSNDVFMRNLAEMNFDEVGENQSSVTEITPNKVSNTSLSSRIASHFARGVQIHTPNTNININADFPTFSEVKEASVSMVNSRGDASGVFHARVESHIGGGGVSVNISSSGGKITRSNQ